MVRLSLLILNSWSSLDSHRWKRRKNVTIRFRILTSSHIIRVWGKNIETSRYMWNSVLYSGYQEPVSRIRTYRLSYLKLCPLSGQIVSCGAGKLTYFTSLSSETLKKKNLLYELTICVIYGLAASPFAAVTSHLLFLNVDTKKPKKLWPLLQNKHPCRVLRWTGSWERLWCSSSLDNGFFLERLVRSNRLHEDELIKQTMEVNH